jgi:hypothetical protein
LFHFWVVHSDVRREKILSYEPNHGPTSGGANQDYRSYYTEKTKAIIGKLYQADLEQFDYQF